jgi:UDP-GlcNAc:undecaprenyl-phosphate GlcNAc-1-phosphate transferase
MISIFFNSLEMYLAEFIFLSLSFLFVSFKWIFIFNFFNLKKYEQRQRVHVNEIPRIGGLLILSFYLIVILLNDVNDFFKVTLLCSIPILLIGLREDFFHDTSPSKRLFSIFLSASLLIFYLKDNLPSINMPLFSLLLQHDLINFLFFVFCIMVISNGFNLIDGMNGNLAFTSIVQFVLLFFLGFNQGDNEFVGIVLLFLIPFIIFSIFNFPFGKVFMGDFGAYFTGFIISSLTIYIYGIYSHLPSWGAVLILFYPSIELLFSFIRKKVFENKSPMSADLKHLHSLLFRLLKRKYKFQNNSLVTLILSFLWLTPLLHLVIYKDVFKILFLLFFLVFIYFFTYIYINHLLTKKND